MRVYTSQFWLAYCSFFMAVLELVILVGVIYINEIGGDISPILRVNFWIFIITGSIGFMWILLNIFLSFISEAMRAKLEKKNEFNR